VLTLVDLAGHESYLRTTCYGCTAHFPDFAMVVVGANAGLIGMSREHVGIALALKVPAFFVVSKIDFSPEEKTKATVADLVAVLKRPGVRKRPFIVRTDADVFSAAYNMASDTIAPIFLVSCVDGRGLDRLRLYLNLLPQRTDWGLRETEPAEFHIDDVFSVSGVGTVVAGTLKSGTITDASRLLLGPDPGDGQFKAAVVRSIHFKSAPASRVVAGQAAALALKKVKRGAVRKGMVLVAPSMAPQATWTFDAEVSVLTHSSTIVPRYQAVIHVGVVRQTAVIVSLSCDGGVLRSGGHAVVTFRFLLRPEYIVSGARFIFREVRRVDASKVAPATDVAYAQGRTKGVGVVLPPGTLKA
jgi:GTPase